MNNIVKLFAERVRLLRHKKNTPMVLFAFTTLLGNLYYVDNALIYLYGKK